MAGTVGEVEPLSFPETRRDVPALVEFHSVSLHGGIHRDQGRMTHIPGTSCRG